MVSRKDKYELQKEVGRGAFGEVYLAVRKEDGLKVAVKKMKRSSGIAGIDWTALREVKLLQELKHPNVVNLVDVFALKDSMNMVMEFCPFDLKKVIDNNSILLSEEHIKSYMKMTLQGLQAVHEMWILHRDMKPDNLLVGDDRQVKIADFGLASIYGEPDDENSYKVVTLPYRAPELLFGAREYGVGVDVWAAGCIMAEMMIRMVFLPGMDEEDQLGKIFYMFGTPSEKDWPKVKSLPKYLSFQPKSAVSLKDRFGSAYSKDAVDLVIQLMSINPNDRPSAEEALKHPFFTSSAHPATPIQDLPFDVLIKK